MAQSALNSGSKWMGAHHKTYKAKDLVNGQILRTGLANGVIVRHSWSAGECTPLGALYGPKPQCINGYINHGYEGKSTKTAPPKKLWTKDGARSGVTIGSAAEKVRSTDVPDGISTNGALSGMFDEVAPDPCISASQKKRRRKKFRHKKRDEEVTSQGRSALPLQEKEDWEKEIQDTTIKDWEKMSFGIVPYGPEDIIPYAVRELRFPHEGTVNLPLTGSYNPGKHHPRPIRWTCYKIPTEPDQFADAE